MDRENQRFAPGQVSHEDKYMASIELSNACRQFYKSRLEEAHSLKTRWQKQKQAHQSRCSSSSSSSSSSSRPSSNDNDRPVSSSSICDNRPQRSSIDEAMDKLRAEMTSLMDQDLSLMKQLLTLNETIEDLKWQRRYYCSPRSSADLHHSDCSLSDTDMYESDDDLLCRLHPSSPSSPSATTSTTTTATIPVGTMLTCRRHSQGGLKGELKRVDSQVVLSESAVKEYHGEQDSFDSGIHESCSSEEESLEASV